MRRLLLFCAALALAVPVQAQQAAPSIAVTGAVAQPLTLTAADLAAAPDGYQVVFSAGELDPGMTDGQFLLADKANGKPLSGESGSFRLVVPKDKHGARSIRMLTSLNVVQLRK